MRQHYYCLMRQPLLLIRILLFSCIAVPCIIAVITNNNNVGGALRADDKNVLLFLFFNYCGKDGAAGEPAVFFPEGASWLEKGCFWGHQ